MKKEEIKCVFYKMVKNRSEENIASFKILYEKELYGNCISILRQELDSYVRMIYLKCVPKTEEFRLNLMQDTINGEKWRITDRKMLDDTRIYAKGWEESVYQLGCAFIHLSNFHNYKIENPFSKLSQDKQNNIINFIKDRHSIELLELTIENLIPVLPLVMDKISSNLQYELTSNKDE